MSSSKFFSSTTATSSLEFKKQKRKLWSRYIGISLVIIQIVIFIMFLFALFNIDIIPNKYLILINVTLILATFNTKTKQALLVTTPRNYYITLFSNSGDRGLDKLTHAGNFGIQGSVKALQNLYGIYLDYYLKINFTGTIGIVDALGGITIDSEVAFNSSSKANSFVVGPNSCNGAKTLLFCRERYAFSNGDHQRGRNQMFAIKGIIAKATSPAIITNYSGVLNSVTNLFETNMPTDAITALIKKTLDSSTPWNILSYNVSGTGDTKYCELFGSYRSVVIPDYNTVNNAKGYISKIQNGEIFQIR